jgi:flagellar hook protein FlgE
MTGSFFTALSGLQAQQNWIDVIGNNLANTNTSGYKSQSASFSDLFSSTLRFASAPGSGFGGTNPVQLGHGVQLSDVERDFNQGALQSTGNSLDVAMQGRGFFAVTNGTERLFTRVGTFGLDGAHNLVEKRSGMKVLDTNGAPIVIDSDSLFPPHATSQLSLAGNLPADVHGPLPEVLTANSAFAQGVPVTLTGSNAGPFTIPTGETWTMGVIVDGGTPHIVSVTSAGGTVTAAAMAAAIDAVPGVNASVDAGGHVVASTEQGGDAASLRLVPGTTGLDLTTALGLGTTLVHGTQTAVTGVTTLNDLPSNITNYAVGDAIQVSGVDADGTPVNATFTYGAANDGTTVDDLVNFINTKFPQQTASLDTSGKLVMTANTPGAASMILSITDSSSAVGQTQWGDYAVSVTQPGTTADTVSTAVEVFDPAGLAHTLTIDFERQANGSWNATPSLDSGDGTVISGPITGITFAADGSPQGLGSVPSDVIVTFTGATQPQTIGLTLGADGTFAGLTQFGAGGSVAVQTQDGFAVGSLSSLSVNADGGIAGFYSNGQSRTLGKLGIATFTNPDGLSQEADGMYAQSTNSGTPNLGAGNVGSAGKVVGGALENSNVDTAEQFVLLIEAQRGYEANAKVITAQDELLKNLVQTI